mmetsp:Transcript_30715/g.99003  ORF Transcript_30715/g.99003 Transcript_30715/m.99003 type:complete len:249 (-) Transcript_30715:664-1410(-)
MVFVPQKLRAVDGVVGFVLVIGMEDGFAEVEAVAGDELEGDVVVSPAEAVDDGLRFDVVRRPMGPRGFRGDGDHLADLMEHERLADDRQPEPPRVAAAAKVDDVALDVERQDVPLCGVAVGLHLRGEVVVIPRADVLPQDALQRLDRRRIRAVRGELFRESPSRLVRRDPPEARGVRLAAAHLRLHDTSPQPREVLDDAVLLEQLKSLRRRRQHTLRQQVRVSPSIARLLRFEPLRHADRVEDADVRR